MTPRNPTTARHTETWIVRAIAAAALCVSGCLSTPLAAQGAGDARLAPTGNPFVDPSTVDASIPPPDEIIGHTLADGAVRYDAMVRYLEALADASPYVSLTPYAKSHEGRTLYYLTITSEANRARLDRIRADNAKLFDPRQVESDPEARLIIDSLPGIAWLAYAIHGDELSSTDAALQVAYQLAAGTDADTSRLRNELVVHIDPLMNPDGRERYLGQLQQLNGRVPNHDHQAMQHMGLWSAGRGNHYLFDLNRDWLMQVHPETRGRSAVILDWHPHLVVDSHEMGPLDTYLFEPPREPFNVSLSEQNMAWRRRFSEDQGKAFDQHGWSYYTGEWYEEWYPGYTNAWANLLGAIGILYEQAGVDGSAIRQESGVLLTYGESVHHHVVSSFANLESLRAHRKAILRDLFEDKRWAVDPAASGTETLLVRPPADGVKFARFSELLSRHGIEHGVASQPFTAADVVDLWGDTVEHTVFPEGTLIVRAAQPQRRLLGALLEFDPHMSDAFLYEERKDLELGRGSRVYDVTGWNLCMAYGLEAHWAGRVEDVPVAAPSVAPTDTIPAEAPAYGYLVDGASSDVYRLIVRLLEKDCKVRVGRKPFAVQERRFEPGAILLRKHENPDDLQAKLRDAAAGLDVQVHGADTALSQDGPDLGGRQFTLLVPPRTAIASQWPMSSTAFGAIWHRLDTRVGLRTSPVNVQFLGRGDLRRYNVIVLPNAWSTGGLGAVLNDGVRKKLKRWVEAGGTLIAIGGSAAFLADKDRGLSSVRLRRNVLDKLEAYTEAVEREKSARDIQIDPAKVWGRGGDEAPASDSTGGNNSPTEGGGAEDDEPGSHDDQDAAPDESKRKKKAKSDKEALAREDTWRRRFSARGPITSASVDPEHWLCFGAASGSTDDLRLPVLLFGSRVFLSKPPVDTPVRLAEAESLRMSGLLWPEARERFSESAYLTRERVGNGQIILFASDPIFRGYFEGSGRLLLNAVLLGPGLGTSQPVPW